MGAVARAAECMCMGNSGPWPAQRACAMRRAARAIAVRSRGTTVVPIGAEEARGGMWRGVGGGRASSCGAPLFEGGSE